MHRRSRPFRNLLPNFLQRLRPGGNNDRSSRSSTISGDGGSYTETMSMLSMPATYSGGYYDLVVDDSDESESLLTVSDLDSCQSRRVHHDSEPYYAEYANLGDRGIEAVGEATPTNSPTPKPSPKAVNALWETGPQLSSPKVARIESMRDTHRRMKALTQSFPSFILDTQLETPEEPDEDAKLGFANIPDQMHRKAVKKGFNFTLMIAGESGLGKATLVNSLFMQDLYKDRASVDASEKVKKVTKIEKRQIELDERGVKLRLTIVDTPGFNDAVNAEDCWKPIEDYIDSTFEQYFKDECGLNRKNIQDNRVHCCLYFISPYGHGLRQVDVEFMRRLQNKVNIVPVIAKADALTASELRTLKDRIMSDLDKYKIDIYRLPECDSDEEEDIKRLDREIKAMGISRASSSIRLFAKTRQMAPSRQLQITHFLPQPANFSSPEEYMLLLSGVPTAVLPFAVIGSNCVIEGEGGKRVRGRQYPWGVVEVENPKHCDFTKLRIFLLKTHMQDLKDMTLEVHYENYRAKYITERMSRRQTDRREVGGVPRADRENGPGFEAIMGADCLLRQKEDERSSAKSLDQMTRGKNSDAILANHGATGSATTNGGAMAPRSAAMPGPGTLPPKAGLAGL
ncbi:unnamed protein product [Mesocestoides corti]|uniref:Septin-type G domain-containing protein n=1 Tax=Mesocestoides corti TaxID=53468 RepID=A0A158QV26_MESCO|nr:unnamed protein product [Mesocestoides corti]